MSGSKDFRLDEHVKTSDKYSSPLIYRAMKLSGDYKASMLDDNMNCLCDCVIQRGCDTDKCTDKSGDSSSSSGSDHDYRDDCSPLQSCVHFPNVTCHCNGVCSDYPTDYD